jgi:hypothetical protein
MYLRRRGWPSDQSVTGDTIVFAELIRTLEDPHARHAAFVHFPIALAFVAALAALVLAATGFRHQATRIVVLALLVGTALGAGFAAGAGEDAYEAVEDSRPPLTAIESRDLHDHEELGENGWMWPAGAAVLVALTFIPRPPIRIAAGVLATIACLGVAGWVGYTGHTGGRLVYTHGLGVPERTPGPPAPADDHDEGEHEGDRD